MGVVHFTMKFGTFFQFLWVVLVDNAMEMIENYGCCTFFILHAWQKWHSFDLVLVF